MSVACYANRTPPGSCCSSSWVEAAAPRCTECHVDGDEWGRGNPSSVRCRPGPLASCVVTAVNSRAQPKEELAKVEGDLWSVACLIFNFM